MVPAPRVLLIGSYADSLINFRGDLIRALLAQGVNVDAAAPALSEHSPTGRTLAGWGVAIHAVSLARTGQNPLQDLRTLRELFRLCRRVRPSHVLAYTAKPVIYGLSAARLAGVPHRTALITGLGYAFTNDSGDPKRRLLSSLLSALYRGALRGADQVVFQNPDDRALFVARGLAGSDRAVVVPGSGVHLERFACSEPPGTSALLHFLCIARLLRDKGIREYAQAARRLRADHPHTRFHLVGDVDSNPAAISRRELDAWVAEGSIEYHGWQEDVRPAIASCHVYVLPSYREGTPRTVLEAMAMGRAIVTTDVPGCRETVEPQRNGFLVPARDAGALADALARFVREPALIARFGARSRELAERKFDVRIVNRRLLELMGLAEVERLSHP
jgi:glycosyltransferase involved in cell wall biosynthesis